MSRRTLYYSTLLLLLFSLALPTSIVQSAPSAKIAPALLERFAAAGRTDMIVRFVEQADLSPAFGMDWHDRGWFVYEALRATAARSQAGAIDYVKGRRLEYRTFIAGNELYVYAGDLAAANALAALPEVATIAAPRAYYVDRLLASAPREQPHALTWGVTDVKADQFWSTFGLQGDGIVVASIDTGVAYLHPALDQAYKCQANPGDPACWYDPSGSCPTAPCDTTPHGTPTLGPILADDDPSLPYQAGVAPNAQWIACRGCSPSACDEASLNACADWVLAPGGSPDNRPDIVYNGWAWSLGCDNWFQPKVDAWLAAGLFATFAPGAQGSACATLTSPGDYQGVFAGTAHDSSRNITSLASRGPSCFGHDPYTKPNISAPGVGICVPVPPDGWNCGYSGVSFSSAFPAGAAALLWSCAPSLRGQVNATFEALQDAADTPPAGNCGGPPDGEGNYTYGYGYLNALAAGLAHCVQGPGVLAGHVYDAGTGNPIAGATVTALPGPVQDTTDPQGYYSMTLDAGPYTVTAAAAGHLSTTVAVVVAGGFTTTQDFSLSLPPAPPIPSFATDSPVCLGTAMHFTDTSQANPPATAWHWAFGDGGTSDQQNPAHTYGAAGDFAVTLWVTNAGGMSWTTSLATVLPLAEASFVYTPSNGLAPLTVTFTSTSANAYSPTWAFGDGGTAGGNVVSHTYGTAGAFVVTLAVQGDCGGDMVTATVEAMGAPLASFGYAQPAVCPPSPVFFTDTSAAYPPILAWSWAFGDGGVSTAPNPMHTYNDAGTFTVTLRVTNSVGSDGVSDTLSVHPLANPSFSLWPAAGLVPLTVYFTNTSESAISPTWAFGDGGIGAGDHVSHTYTLSGTYHFTLTVQSPYGCGEASRAGTVAAGCNPVDVVSVTTDISGCVVTLGAVLTGTPPFEVLMWNLYAFGTSTETNPTVDFQTSGTYSGTLYVTNCAGQGVAVSDFAVVVACAPPMPSYKVYLPLVLK